MTGHGQWTRRTCLLVLGLEALGASLIVVSWLGTSGTSRFATQITWLDFGVLGAITGHLGVMVWLLSGRRSLARRRSGLFPSSVPDGTPTAATDHRVEPDVVTRRVFVPGMAHYHRPGCQLVAGKTVTEAGSGTQANALVSCGMCQA